MRNPIEAKYLKEFGKRLSEIRREKQMTQVELAKKAGMTTLSLAYIEQGRRWPRLTTLHGLAKSLMVPIADLFKGL